MRDDLQPPRAPRPDPPPAAASPPARRPRGESAPRRKASGTGLIIRAHACISPKCLILWVYMVICELTELSLWEAGRARPRGQAHVSGVAQGEGDTPGGGRCGVFPRQTGTWITWDYAERLLSMLSSATRAAKSYLFAARVADKIRRAPDGAADCRAGESPDAHARGGVAMGAWQRVRASVDGRLSQP
jgi:hypothetical protein